MDSKFKWFIKWEDEYKGWGVWKDGFRATWFKSKFLAEEERDRLNDEDVSN